MQASQRNGVPLKAELRDDERRAKLKINIRGFHARKIRHFADVRRRVLRL